MSNKKYKKAAPEKPQKTLWQSFSENALEMLTAGYVFLFLAALYPGTI